MEHLGQSRRQKESVMNKSEQKSTRVSLLECTEQKRLNDAREKGIPWKKWGPYLSERQWGTVREDYSQDGNAWDYFSHDQARSRAYRWGEDGLAGISDDKQQLCFAIALWNGRDPILKERLFGLTNSEGNHGEDVKEYYFYLDSTPTPSYMKYLYKYPQNAYPYGDLIEMNRRRGRDGWEYELLDTGVFNDDRYFYVFVEYAKATRTDILIQISVANRGPKWPNCGYCRLCGSATPGPGGRTRRSLPCDRGRERTPSQLKPLMPSSVTSCCIARETRVCCSRRTTPTINGSSERKT